MPLGPETERLGQDNWRLAMSQSRGCDWSAVTKLAFLLVEMSACEPFFEVKNEDQRTIGEPIHICHAS